MNFYNSVALKTRVIVEGIMFALMFAALFTFVQLKTMDFLHPFSTMIGFLIVLAIVLIDIALIYCGLRIEKVALGLPLIAAGSVDICLLPIKVLVMRIEKYAPMGNHVENFVFLRHYLPFWILFFIIVIALLVGMRERYYTLHPQESLFETSKKHDEGSILTIILALLVPACLIAFVCIKMVASPVLLLPIALVILFIGDLVLDALWGTPLFLAGRFIVVYSFLALYGLVVSAIVLCPALCVELWRYSYVMNVKE